MAFVYPVGNSPSEPTEGEVVDCERNAVANGVEYMVFPGDPAGLYE
jgi:hypothetical protein